MKRLLHVIRDAALDGPTNMARDEHLLASQSVKPAGVRTYAWNSPTISVLLDPSRMDAKFSTPLSRDPTWCIMPRFRRQKPPSPLISGLSAQQPPPRDPPETKGDVRFKYSTDARTETQRRE